MYFVILNSRFAPVRNTYTVPNLPARSEDHEKQDDAGKKARKQREIGGPKGPEPTRYGDWERKGRCIDF